MGGEKPNHLVINVVYGKRTFLLKLYPKGNSKSRKHEQSAGKPPCLKTLTCGSSERLWLGVTKVGR